MQNFHKYFSRLTLEKSEPIRKHILRLRSRADLVIITTSAIREKKQEKTEEETGGYRLFDNISPTLTLTTFSRFITR